MFRRGKKVWRTAALVGALLVTVGSGRAMAWQGPGLAPAGWQGAWEWIASWFGGGHQTATKPVSNLPAGRGAYEKSSSQIDPNGLVVPGSSLQSDSSLGIDPNGQH